jgi:hypothetical protein
VPIKDNILIESRTILSTTTLIYVANTHTSVGTLLEIFSEKERNERKKHVKESAVVEVCKT